MKNKGQARLLGDWVLELGPLIPSLTDIHGIGVRRALEFSRTKDGSEVTVGRFTVLLKLVGEYMTQYPGLEGTNLTGPKKSFGEIHLLPPEDSNFKWRIRADIRAAIDFPLNRVTPGGLPSWYVEIGWSLYEQTEPDEYTKIMSVLVEKNRHPHWNQQLLFNNPSEVIDLSGFLWISLRDKNAIEPIEKFAIPLEYFIPFTPVHLEVHCRSKGEEAGWRFYCSLVLERPLVSAVDSLWKVVMSWADFKPIPSNHKKFAIMLTTDSHSPTDSPYIKADLSNEEGLQKAFQMQNSLKYTSFLSPWMRIPPDPMDNIYNALAAFTIPKSYLDRKTVIYLVVKDETKPTVHAMPSIYCGFTDLLDEYLKSILYSPGNQRQYFEITYNKASSADISKTRSYLELACYPLDGIDDFDKASDVDDPRMNLNKLISSGPSGVEDKEKWQLLSRELAQKQEIIHRMMKEVDDKTQSLKLTSAEIIDLRRTVKMLQSENAILRK